MVWSLPCHGLWFDSHLAGLKLEVWGFQGAVAMWEWLWNWLLSCVWLNIQVCLSGSVVVWAAHLRAWAGRPLTIL